MSPTYRSTFLIAILGIASAAGVITACGTSGDSTFEGESKVDSGSSTDSSNPIFDFGDSSVRLDGSATGGKEITSMHIVPADAVLTTTPGKAVTQAYKVLGTVEGSADEVDLTDRAVFYVPDNYLVGGFPLNGSALFTSRLADPMKADDPPQRGGKLTVQAQAALRDGGTVTVTTSLTVNVNGSTSPADGGPLATPAIPTNAGDQFVGAADANRAPTLIYPNDGAMLPPNLKRLEVHFTPKGGSDTKLYDVWFKGATSDVHYYTRCYANPASYTGSGCVLELDETAYALVAESNKGQGPVQLKVRGSNEAAGTPQFGESATFTIEFAENAVNGGVYYWSATNPPQVVRFDFGAERASTPEPYLAPGDMKTSGGGANTQCVGCHSISRDGKKLFASVGGASVGQSVFIGDLSKPKTNAGWLTYSGTSDPSWQNNGSFGGSFSPKGDQIAGITAPAGDGTPSTKITFFDGTTGLKTAQKDVGFPLSHLSWSPNGKQLAMTKINGNAAIVFPYNKGIINAGVFLGGSIAMMEGDGAGTWGTPFELVPRVANKNRYNPNFNADGSFLYYTETACDNDWICDAYVDPAARTYAVASKASSTPVLLANANKPGVADGATTNLGDTFPRSTPFITKHKAGTLMWFTVSSRRKAGLRARFPNTQPNNVGNTIVANAEQLPDQTLLWMFAVDPAKVLAGQDGSYPGFFLPFQDLKTSNHMAEWTEKIVSDKPPPAPVAPPPPAPAPPPVITN